VDRFRDSNDVELIEYPATNINFLDFSNTRQGEQIVYLPPFDDIKVRQAVGYAVNTQEIVDGVLAGIGVRNKAPLHNGNFASQPEFAGGFEYDADQANALLDEAGWAMGDDDVREKDGEPLSIVFMTTNFTTLERVAQLIQNQLQQVGFEVEIVSLEPASYSERRGTEDWNLLLGRDGWPEPDALHFLSHLPDRVGFGRYSEYNAEFEEVLTEARTVSDLDQRRALYEQIAQIILDDAALIPLWSDVNVVGVRSEVRGFEVGPQGRWVFQDAQVSD
jgi:peptide/nickel transport system substrate-binding protein